MPLAIPLVDTVTAGDLPDINDVTAIDVAPDTSSLPAILDSDIITLQREAEETARGATFYEGDFKLRVDELRRIITTNNSLVKPWTPNTDFYAQYTDPEGLVHAPDIVTHLGDIYTVVVDFTSGVTFSDYEGELVLDRVTMDRDLQYIELPFSAVGPFLPNQTIGMYNTIARVLLVKEVWDLPNTFQPHPAGVEVSAFYCNPEVTTNTVVTIYRKDSAGADIAVGTITFDPLNNTTNYCVGELVATAGGQFTINRNEILVAKLTTVAAELSWVSLNMLGQTISVRSPNFNIPV